MVMLQADLATIARALKMCEEYFEAKTYAQANVDDAQRETFRRIAAINEAQIALNKIRGDRGES